MVDFIFGLQLLEKKRSLNIALRILDLVLRFDKHQMFDFYFYFYFLTLKR